MKKYFFIISLFILALIGIALLLLATSRSGVNLETDSIYYINFARSFENCLTNKEAMGDYLSRAQPLFPFVLSWGGIIGMDPAVGARWLNSLLFGLNIILAGIITKRYTGSSWLGLTGALLMLSAPDIMEIHLTAMSEPLFIFFMLIWLLLFFDYLKNPKFSILIFSSIIVALASMTRFAGIPIVATGLFVILFLNREGNLVHKFIHAVIFVSIPCLFLFLWGRYSYNENSLYQKHFAFHPVHFSCFRDMVSVFFSWFLTPNVRASANEKTLLFTIGMVFCFIRLFFWRRIDKTQEVDSKKIIFTKFSILGTAFICLYVVCLILAASFYDAAMDGGGWDRYFIPIHVAGLIMFCGFMSIFFSGALSSFRNDIGKIIIIYFFLFYIVGSTKCLIHQYYSGGDYTNNPYRSSYIIRKIKMMPADTLIYTNFYEIILIFDGRSSFFIPFVKNPFSLEKNDKYSDQIVQMEEHLRNKKGVLVYFNEADFPRSTESIESLQQKMPLHLIARDSLGAIFELKGHST